MSSLKETRDLLLVSRACQRNHKRKWICHSLWRKYVKKTTISVRELWRILTGQFQQRIFRVEKNDLPVLADVLGIPPVFRCSQRSVFEGMEGLCMLLKRLAYPCRYSDMIPRFGRPVPEISMMTNVVLDWIYNEHGHHLTDFNQPFLSRASLRTYAGAIHQKGAALNNCWGFVDGTVRSFCRPLQNQRIVCSGLKRVHALKFQSTVTLMVLFPTCMAQ